MSVNIIMKFPELHYCLQCACLPLLVQCDGFSGTWQPGRGDPVKLFATLLSLHSVLIRMEAVVLIFISLSRKELHMFHHTRRDRTCMFAIEVTIILLEG